MSKRSWAPTTLGLRLADLLLTVLESDEGRSRITGLVRAAARNPRRRAWCAIS
jgi:hypothetical protein